LHVSPAVLIKSDLFFLSFSVNAFSKSIEKSFDYAILEKSKKINAIKLNIPWSDLGSWKEILLMYHRNKAKYFRIFTFVKRLILNIINFLDYIFLVIYQKNLIKENLKYQNIFLKKLMKD